MIDITYTVEFRPPGPLSGTTKLVDVIGDGIDKEFNFRFFQMQDGTMVHAPLDSVVKFSKERMVAVKSKIQEETGR